MRNCCLRWLLTCIVHNLVVPRGVGRTSNGSWQTRIEALNREMLVASLVNRLPLVGLDSRNSIYTDKIFIQLSKVGQRFSVSIVVLHTFWMEWNHEDEHSFFPLFQESNATIYYCFPASLHFCHLWISYQQASPLEHDQQLKGLVMSKIVSVKSWAQVAELIRHFRCFKS